MVYVYFTDVSKLPDPLESPEIMEGLSEERKHKILKLRQLLSRKQSLGAGKLLQKILESKGLSMDDIYYDDNGKPLIKGLCFNLSHSEEAVVCAVGDSTVGIDIEKIRNVKDHIADRYFTDGENAHLAQFVERRQKEEFFRLWTMKESYMKYTGEGMKLALDSFEFQFLDDIRVFRDGKQCECHIKEYDVVDHKLTVCAKENEFADKITYIEIC